MDYFRVPRPLWRRVKKWLARVTPVHRVGRKRADNRKVLNEIWYVLWTGCQWKAVHRSWFGVCSSHGLPCPVDAAFASVKFDHDSHEILK